MAANLDTAFFVSRAYATALAAAKQGGSLLLFSSVDAAIGVANHAAIAAAKGGFESLARSLAAFLLSDAAGRITGQVIGLDGGFSAVRPYVKAG